MPENYISKVKLPGDETVYDIRAHKTAGIYYAQVDSTSTSTNFTATIADLNIDAYYDGLTILLYNGKVTSASGFTININGLGAKPSYSNMALGNPTTPTDPTRDTTIFNINYAMLFTYNSTRVSGGCWICYRGYDANTNTIGYQLRTNQTTMPTTDKFYRYRLLFTSADHNHWVPANTSTSTNATAKRDTIQRPIDPFGEIVWYGTTTAIEANANVTAAQLWQQYYGSYTNIGYSFNRTGAAQTMTATYPIYIKCAPQSDGSAIIDADTPYVQALPNSEDGKIYIFLGRAYNATNFEILMNHPVYYYKDGAIRLWSNAAQAGTINNATLTIQKNSDTVGTFTANASTDVTVNITAQEPPLVGQANDSTASDYIGPLQVWGALSNNKQVFVSYYDSNSSINYTFSSWSKSYDTTDDSMFVIGNCAYQFLIGSLQGWNFLTINVPTSTSELTNDGDDGTHPFLATDDVATVATTGNYSDLTGTPSDGSATIASVSSDVVTLKAGVSQSGLTIGNSNGSDITLAKVAKTGAYGDLSGTPSVPTKTSDLTNDGDDGTHAFLATDDVVSTYSSSGTAPVNGTAVAAALATMPSPMVFKGTVGDSGTPATIAWTTLLSSPTVSKVGDTYKVISAHNTTPICKVGDTIICTTGGIGSTSIWAVVPSGDEPSGTVTNIATGSGLTGGPISTTGTISHADTSTQASSTNSGRTYIQSVGLDDFGHVTSLSTATETVTIPANNITGSGTSGSLAKFNGANTITDGPAFGSSQTTFLANDGQWRSTGTVTSVAIAAANGSGITVDSGSPITSSGTITLGTSGLEKDSNKVTSLSSSSTDTEYPSAKLLYTTTAPYISYEMAFSVIQFRNFASPLPTTVSDLYACEDFTTAVKKPIYIEFILTGFICQGTLYIDKINENNALWKILLPQAITTQQGTFLGVEGTLAYVEGDGWTLTNSTFITPDAPDFSSLSYTASGLSASKTITSLSETDGIISATASDIAITSDQVTRNTTDATIATNDKLGIFDASDSNKLKSSSITFDTTKTGTYLRRDGTWAAPTGLIKVYDTTDIVQSTGASPSSVIAFGELNQGVIDDIIADSATHQVVIVDNNNVLQTQDPEKNHFIVTSSVGGQDARFYAISTSYIFHAYYDSGHEVFEIYDAPAPSHSHGSITNEGTIQASNTPIATGDRLLIRQNSGGHITSSPIYFSANAGAYLRQDGAWSIPTGLVGSWGTDELGIQTTTPSTGLIMEGTINQGLFNDLDGSTYYYVCMITDEDGEFTACPNLTYYFYERTTESNIEVLNYVSYDAANSRFVLLKIKDNDTFTISEISIGAQGDFVRYDTNAQGLTTTEQGNARTNIAAAASSHTHGNITNDGKIGSTANYAVYTTTGGALTASAALPTTTTNATIAALPVWSAAPTDSTYFIRQDTGGSSSFGRVPFSTVNTYIKSKNPALNYITYDSTEDAIKFVFPS